MPKTRLILAAALALAITVGMPCLAAQPVTTLEQQEAIWDLVIGQIQKDPAALTKSLSQIVPQYGYWCGMQSTDPTAVPIDCVDAACRDHDLSAGYSSTNPTLAQIGQADQDFVAQLFSVTASTPYGELYRIEAIDIFTQKITYEQANHVSLITACSDCLTGQ